MFRPLLAIVVLSLMVGCLPEKSNSASLPSGTVIAFAGPSIPAGYTLCDGSTTSTGLVTPDLRGRFIMGGSMEELLTEGGSSTHAHTGTTGDAEGTRVGVDKDNDYQLPIRAHQHSLQVEEAEHLPPYVSLVYIMKD